MKKVLLTVLAAGLIFTGCGKSVVGPLGPAGSSIITQTVTAAAGGVVNAGTVSVNIPAGALSMDTAITVSPLSEGSLPAIPPGGKALVAAATFGPESTTFSTPVTITFALKTPETSGSTIPMFLYNWDGNGTATVAADGNTATGAVTHFSTYAVMSSYSYVTNSVTHNHFSCNPAAESGYFDFSVNREPSMTGLSTGDFAFKSYAGDESLGYTSYFAGDDGATGGIQQIEGNNIDLITTAPTTGYLYDITVTWHQDTNDFINKCFAVKTQEGEYVVLQITGIDKIDQWPQYINFRWKYVQ